MKRAQLFGLLFAWFICLFPAFGQGQVPPGLVVTASDTVDPLTAHVINLAVQYPWILGALALMGSLRVIFKPGMALIRMAVRSTPSPADDQFLDRVEAHPLFSAFGWILDLLTSIKLDTVRTAVAARRPSSASSPGTPPLPAFLLPLFLASCLLPLGLLTGCATTGADSGPITPARVQKIARLAVWTTATGLIVNRPDRLVAFEKAQKAIDQLVAEQTWDVGALSKALVATGEKQFTGSEGRMIMAGTALLIETIAGERVDLNNQEYIRAVILGAQDGLNLALGER